MALISWSILTLEYLGNDFKGSEVRFLREPVTVSVDDPAMSHWETGKV
jgi:hypothetical protein